MKIKDIMNEHVITITPDATLKEVSDKFAEHNISGMPVVDDDKIVGIITETDILGVMSRYVCKDDSTISSGAGLMGCVLENTASCGEYAKSLDALRELKVSDSMKKNVITITSDKPLEDAIAMMASKKINRLPVVENDRLVGILTRNDLVKVLAKV